MVPPLETFQRSSFEHGNLMPAGKIYLIPLKVLLSDHHLHSLLSLLGAGLCETRGIKMGTAEPISFFL